MSRVHSINLISTDVGRRPAHAYESLKRRGEHSPVMLYFVSNINHIYQIPQRESS